MHELFGRRPFGATLVFLVFIASGAATITGAIGAGAELVTGRFAEAFGSVIATALFAALTNYLYRLSIRLDAAGDEDE